LDEVYVDDTCTAIQSDSISHFHDHLNSINAKIQFMYETEKDGSLSFLDILLSHDLDGSVHTSVYQKPTHTDQYLQFSSYHRLSPRMFVVRTLFVHAGSLSTSLVEWSVEERHIVNALRSNGYLCSRSSGQLRAVVGPTKTPMTPQRESLSSCTFKAYQTPSRESLESKMLGCVFDQLGLSGRSW